jgi:hypothetical protein
VEQRALDVDRLLEHYASLHGEPQPVVLEASYLRAVREVEDLPCNQPGEDKSWVLRVEENRQRFFANVRRRTDS